MNILDILSNPLSEKMLPGFLKGLEKSFFSTNNKKDYPSQPLKWNMYEYLQKQKSANVSVEHTQINPFTVKLILMQSL